MNIMIDDNVIKTIRGIAKTEQRSISSVASTAIACGIKNIAEQGKTISQVIIENAD